MLLTSALENIGIGDAAIVAVLGYSVVFFGLILLMCVIMIIGKIFMAKDKKAAATVQTAAPAAAAAPAAVQEVPGVPAPGTAGKLKLHDVDPKTAAIIMAIVADKMGKPLNELRFISIKEVEK